MSESFSEATLGPIPSAIEGASAPALPTVSALGGAEIFVRMLEQLGVRVVFAYPAKAIILDNQHLGMVQQWEDHLYEGVHAHTDLADPSDRTRPCPDWVTLVQSFGVRCERVSRRDELVPALERMLAAREAYVLDVVTPYQRHVLPFIPAGGAVAEMKY